ncbi:TetR family transcriptional regulator [Oceanibacterium hippocampi]|uniref:Bacterial regulatory proteins, tetR family n=1 Tax=Oceanibacterium hippocampi TaxID=745714 RepID=A0A1Y5T8A0_9PROT|nr:TetR family transcriptional regulator [Oceanibacterium hippocampi]SLN57954.1 Bacterial regulatory proteins, tetR family [Oceanibacterium hippocampi]
MRMIPINGRRARSDDQKKAREAAILEAAEAIFVERRVLPPIAEVAARAGLAKGTVYLYFRGKNELFLALLEQRLHAALDALQELLAQPAIDAGMLVDGLVAFFLAHPTTLDLARFSDSHLEHEGDVEAIYGFKRDLATRTLAVGAEVERCFPALRPGEGARLVYWTFLFLQGIWQAASPPAPVREALARPGLELFRLDFEREARDGLMAFWRPAADKARQNS